jgi:hypothetical protein
MIMRSRKLAKAKTGAVNNLSAFQPMSQELQAINYFVSVLSVFSVV